MESMMFIYYRDRVDADQFKIPCMTLEYGLVLLDMAWDGLHCVNKNIFSMVLVGLWTIEREIVEIVAHGDNGVEAKQDTGGQYTRGQGVHGDKRTVDETQRQK